MIFDILTEVEPVNFFKFFVNPNSFSQSVENLFYLSFLIRDSKMAIEEDPDTNELVCCIFSFI